MKIRCDYLAGTNVIYIGYALPGTAENLPLWRIAFFTYDANDNVLTVDFANGTADFVSQWSLRTTYPYS